MIFKAEITVSYRKRKYRTQKNKDTSGEYNTTCVCVWFIGAPLLSPLNFLSSRRSWSSNSRSNCICSIWASMRSLVVSDASLAGSRSGAGLAGRNRAESGMWGGWVRKSQRSGGAHKEGEGKLSLPLTSSSCSCLASSSLMTSARGGGGATGVTNPQGPCKSTQPSSPSPVTC